MVNNVPAPGKEALYEVVYPIGRAKMKVPPAPVYVTDFRGKTVCGSGHTYEGDETMTVLVGLLQKQYPDIKFIPNSEMPDTVATREEMAALQNVLREKGCDIVLSGIGC